MKKKIVLLLMSFSIIHATVPNTCDILAADPRNKSNPLSIEGVDIKEIDSKKAIKACLKSINDFPGEPRYIYQLGRGYTKEGNFKKAVECYIKASKQGDPSAQRYIGFLYYYGLSNVKRDYQKALEWYVKSANQGNIEAQNELSDLYTFSSSVEQNDTKAFEWRLKAAKQDDALAQRSIGRMYYSGRGVEQNFTKALKWFLKIDKRKHEYYSPESIANMYFSGKGTTRDYKKALEWYIEANSAYQKKYKEGGIPYVEHRIGSIYYLGLGVKKDYKKAFEWFRKSAQKNYIDAQERIGYMYSVGKGVRKNYKQAFEWSMKAAKGGSSFSQDSIAHAYYAGEGVKKNYIKAYAWLSLFLSSSDEQDHMREYAIATINKLESKMTPQQIAIAQSYDPIKENRDKKQTTKKDRPSLSSVGTGFFVNPSNLLTNNHVVDKCKNIELVNNGYRTSAIILALDPRNDLAILTATKPNNKSLLFRAGKGIRIGNEVIVLGYPLGELLGSGIKLTTGDVSSMTGIVNDVTAMQITAPVQPGNSGGPLLDKSGNVVGVIYSRVEKSLSGRLVQNVNLAIKSNVAQMFLDTNSIDYNTAISKNKKDVADIANTVQDGIVQVVCYP